MLRRITQIIKLAALAVVVTTAAAAAAQPAGQIALERIRAGAVQPYNAADTQMKKSLVLRQAGSDSFNLVKGARGAVKDWRGKLVELTTDRGGEHAYVIIESSAAQGFKVRYRTWNNALSDLTDKTAIRVGTPLYAQLAELKPGDEVVFSGTFIPDKATFLKDASLTEAGTIQEPEFLMRFTSIRKAGAAPAAAPKKK